MAAEIKVEVVYALPVEQLVLKLVIPAGSTAMDAVRLSEILERLPQIELKPVKLGIFGRLVDPNAEVQSGDRVEIYRDLIADPKAARRLRAARARKIKAAATTAEEAGSE